MTDEELRNTLILMKHDLEVMRTALQYYRRCYVVKEQAYWREPSVLEAATEMTSTLNTLKSYFREHIIFLSGLLANNPALQESEIKLAAFQQRLVDEIARRFESDIAHVVDSIQKQDKENEAARALALTEGDKGRQYYERLGKKSEG